MIRLLFIRILQLITIGVILFLGVAYLVRQPVNCREGTLEWLQREATQLVLQQAAEELTEPSGRCIGENLVSRNLQGVNLSYTDLTQANLRGSDLSNANLRNADLSGAILVDANLQNADLRGASLIGANLVRADMRNTIFEDTHLTGANLTGVDLTKTDLTLANLHGVILSEARLIEVNLEEADLAGINFTQADLTGANLRGANLSGARLSEVVLSGSTLTDAEIQGALFNLADVNGANLVRANLAGASLIGTDLASSNMTASKLVGAVLIGTNLNGTNLRSVDLTGARLFATELRSSDLTSDPSVSSLNSDQRAQFVNQDVVLSGIQQDDETIWPEGKPALLGEILGSEFQETLPIPIRRLLAQGNTPPPDRGVIGLPRSLPMSVEGEIRLLSDTTLRPYLQLNATEFTTQGFSDTIQIEIVNNTTERFNRLCENPNEIDAITSGRLIFNEENDVCELNEVDPVGLYFANDAIVVVTSPANDFVSNISLETLALLFTSQRWIDVNSTWSAVPIQRYIPSSETDIFQNFSEIVFDGNSEAILAALNTQTDAGVEAVIQNVSRNRYAVGLLSYTHYQQNIDVLNVLSINGFAPERNLVNQRQYPLSYRLYLYSNTTTIREKPQVGMFLSFFITNIYTFLEPSGYLLPPGRLIDRSESALLSALGY